MIIKAEESERLKNQNVRITDIVNDLFPTFVGDKYMESELPFHFLVEKGEIVAFVNIIKEIKNDDLRKLFSKKDSQNHTVLSVIVKNGRWEFVELLFELGYDIFELGFNINDRDKEGRTILHYAAANNNLHLMDICEKFNYESSSENNLLRVLSYLNIQNANNGNTALHEAALNQDTDAMNFLITRGANTNLINKQGYTASYILSSKNNSNLINHEIKDVLYREFYENFNIYKKVQDARLGGIDEVRSILDIDPSLVNQINSDSETPLHLAVLRSDLEIVKLLIAKGAYTNIKNAEGKTALEIAQENDEREIVKFITSLNNISKTSIKDITNPSNVEKAPKTLESIFSYNDIYEAIQQGDSSQVQNILFTNPALVNQIHEDYTSPLHCAILFEQPDIVQLLINYGASLEILNNEGLTPKQLALKSENVIILQIFNNIDLYKEPSGNSNVKDPNYIPKPLIKKTVNASQNDDNEVELATDRLEEELASNPEYYSSSHRKRSRRPDRAMQSDQANFSKEGQYSHVRKRLFSNEANPNLSQSR
ncbi:MAG: ankyrin repeat domain-containing protein [Alphaproteobacteria bacterium]